MLTKLNISLKKYNTFGINASADYFISLKNLSYLQQVTNEIKKYKKYMLLGGGSNILFTKNFEGLVIQNALKGTEKIKENESNVWIKAMAGENWHDLVLYCVDNNYGGIENLSLIPGCVGTAPMQNIGAYGAEIKDVFEILEAYHITKNEIHVFDNEDCKFGYRESVFKNELKNQYIILSVTLKLTKKHKLNIGYGAIKETLAKLKIDNPTIKHVSDAVILIRNNKLPNPNIIGNSGSFFKNPIIDSLEFEKLYAKYPNVPNYANDNGKVKIPAGWLIEQCGWKGKVIGNTGTYKNQALVIVNHGNATGKEIIALSQNIQKSVNEKFNIDLLPEVNIY